MAKPKNPQPITKAKDEPQPRCAPTSSQSPTPAQQVVWLLNVVISVIVSCYMLQLVATQTYTPILLYESTKKSQLLQAFALLISLLLTVHTFSADLLDIVFNKTDNDLYRTHRNIATNTIQWSIVFLGAYLYGGE